MDVPEAGGGAVCHFPGQQCDGFIPGLLGQGLFAQRGIDVIYSYHKGNAERCAA